MILIVIWFSMIFLGLVEKKSKPIAWLQILFVNCMMAFNDGNADQINYIKLLDGLRRDPELILNGNIGTNMLFYVMGLFKNYHLIIFFISLFSMFFLYKGITYYTPKVSYVLSLYLIAPFTIDATQLKNFIAMSVWIYFSIYLFKAYSNDEKKKNMIFYCAGVILATSFHFSFIFTILFVLVPMIKGGDKPRILRAAIAVAILTVIMNRADSVIMRLSKGNARFQQYFDYKLSFYNKISKVNKIQAKQVEVIAFFLLIFACFLMMWIMSAKRDMEDKRRQLLEFSIILSIISIVLIPFMKYSMEIYRVQRNLLVIYYVLMAEWVPGRLLVKNNDKFIFKLSLPYFFAILISGFYLYVDTIHGNFGAVFRVLFKFYRQLV